MTGVVSFSRLLGRGEFGPAEPGSRLFRARAVRQDP